MVLDIVGGAVIWLVTAQRIFLSKLNMFFCPDYK